MKLGNEGRDGGARELLSRRMEELTMVTPSDPRINQPLSRIGHHRGQTRGKQERRGHQKQRATKGDETQSD
jgi:hypothetical protein